MSPRPKFDSPPVVETVLSVQFASLPGYSTAHAGWFWKEYLKKLTDEMSAPVAWSHAMDAPRLEDQFERFGPEDVWQGPSMRLINQAQPQRTQFIRSDGERMIQVQDSRFILNWKKGASHYPSYDSLFPEFRQTLHAFESFALESGLGALAYNQWEIVYVDQIKKGEMWESARDWRRIFPSLSLPVQVNRFLSTGDETMSADWRFSLMEKRGRMHISVRQLRTPPSNEEFLSITFVARGPVNESQTWEQGLELGHEALNETFVAIASSEAQTSWKPRGGK